jgi:hypothetical protein
MNERPTYQDALRRAGLLRILEPFDPHVIGTLPLGVARPNSDIDIICCAADLSAAVELVWKHFGESESFAIYQWSAKGRPVIATFEAYGWPFEIFVSSTPVQDQAGWRHFEVEKRLLTLGGPAFHTAICALRAGGVKTEPAFARALKLEGDPYAVLYDLFSTSDNQLNAVLRAQGFVV